ncbi:ABC transporter ATP-binding protein [Treponema pedis]|uniref:ABC transporter ATP-binding protein n=1 Tax=Treponema pedis TaxID=409322 RepID=A0A7S6WQX9_9SPIR|nr:ABC transporter ATP-binding protein [Treponema pedis]QOW61389.1 ABC transporter ATP-binding protein [Treponema pedis]
MYLQLQNVSKKYGNKFAIRNINFNLEKGKMLCLLGPSGCGKTTILRATGGFIKIDDGKIILDGKDITNVPPEEREVSTVFQSYGLFPNMNVLQNIIYGLKFKNIPKKARIDLGMQMIKTVGLEGCEKKHISELSGGEQQRTALARSLIIRPKLLLLDEPLSSLDAKLKISMRREIKRLQNEFKVTSVFVTHDQSEAFEIADKIILMNEGVIMQEDFAENIYNNPRNQFALDFIGTRNIIDGKYVRPEKITITKDRKNENAKKAVIEQIIFKGETLELLLNIENTSVKALILNAREKYKTGDTVFAEYQPENIN